MLCSLESTVCAICMSRACDAPSPLQSPAEAGDFGIMCHLSTRGRHSGTSCMHGLEASKRWWMLSLKSLRQFRQHPEPSPNPTLRLESSYGLVSDICVYDSWHAATRGAINKIFLHPSIHPDIFSLDYASGPRDASEDAVILAQVQAACALGK